MSRRLPALILPGAVAAGTLWLAFNAGGFFARETALAAAAAAVGLACWLLLARRPLAGLSPWLAVAVGALVAFAVWTLVSQAWSDATARALVEYDRALLYALVVALVGLASGLPAVRRNIPRAAAAVLVAIAASGLVTRLLPELWPIATDVEFERLSFPLTYWNAMGAVGVLAGIAALHLASTRTEPLWVRAPAAAAVPIVAAATLYTFSRGAIFLAPIGVLAYLLLARPAGAVPAVLALLPTTGIALAVAYGADAVVEQTAPTAAGIAEGREVAAVVVACALAAGALLALLRPLERRVARRRGPSPRTVLAGVGVVVVIAAAAAVAVDAPGVIAREAERLERVDTVRETGDSRQRLTQLADNGRVDSWRVALDAFSAEPLRGSGAGTYAVLWTQHRSIDQDVNDGHSLYLEVLAELGLVGAVLLLLGLGALLAGCAARARGPDRGLPAVGFALLLTWAIHAGIDWDWEVPALTLLPLAVAAAAVARPGAHGAASEAAPPAEPAPVRRARWAVRAVVAAGVAALALTPLAVARSQSELNLAVAALHANDCATAEEAAERSIDRLSVRPEPFQVLAVCSMRAGQGADALALMRGAVDRDPRNWRLLYDLAVVRATQRLDPRGALREAQRRNPQSAFVAEAVERFDTDDPGAWRRRGLASTLLV